MTPIELRQKLHHQLDQLSPESLPVVDDFLASLEFRLPPTTGQPIPDDSQPIDAPPPNAFNDFLANLKQQPLRRSTPIRPHAKGKDILPIAGTWQGDDLAACLQILHDTRSESKF